MSPRTAALATASLGERNRLRGRSSGNRQISDGGVEGDGARGVGTLRALRYEVGCAVGVAEIARFPKGDAEGCGARGVGTLRAFRYEVGCAVGVAEIARFPTGGGAEGDGARGVGTLRAFRYEVGCAAGVAEIARFLTGARRAVARAGSERCARSATRLAARWGEFSFAGRRSPWQDALMMAKTLILLGSLIWIAFCMRFWWMIHPRNVWQRRLIAIMAGAGGGLIYVLGSMLQVALTPPPAEQAPAEIRSGDEVRVSMPPPRAK